MTRGSPPSSEQPSEDSIEVPPLQHQPPIITHHDLPPFGLGTSGVVGDTTPAPPSSPSGTPPPETSEINLDDAQREPDSVDSNDNEDDGIFEFPVEALGRLEEMLNRARWVVPVLPKQELELLLDACIRFKKKDMDKENESITRFFDSALQTSFYRLMHDDAVKDWKLEIQRYIYLSCVKVLKLTVMKMGDADIQPLLEVMGYIFNPKNRFHSHNMSKLAESTADKDLTKDDENIFAAPCSDPYPKGWLADLLNHFGSLGGFARLLEVAKDEERQWNLVSICLFARPFGQCAAFLLPRTIRSFILPICEIGMECLKKITDEDLKKQDVVINKENTSRDHVATELALNCSSIYGQLKEDNIKLELEGIRLKIIVRILKVASFAGRMNALSEIHHILSTHFTYNADSQSNLMSKKDVAKCLVELDLVGLALKDNLHQPQYVERVVKILTDLLREKALGIAEMDKLWDAQSGKHDAIQKNVHEMLTKLAWDLSPEQLEHLFGRFTESWKQAGERERERLLMLIRQLAEDDKEGQMAERVLNLLWELAKDPQLPLDIMEMALECHCRILEHAFSLRSDSIRMHWLWKCVEEIKGTEWCLPAMKQLQVISQMFPDNPGSLYPARKDAVYRTDLVCQIQNEFMLVAEASTSIHRYMDSVREMQLPQGSTASGYYVDKKYPHSEQIEQRLKFLKFLLRDGNLWLCNDQASEVWEQLVVKPIFSADRDQGFRFFARLLTHAAEQDLDPDITQTFFERRVLTLDPSVLSPQGIVCFDRFLRVVNSKAGKLITQRRGHHVYLSELDLLGSEYLWKIILQSGEEVSERAIDIFKNVFCRPSPIMYRKLPELHATIIEISMNKLKAAYDTLQLLGREKDSLNRKTESALKMTRVLRTLAAYVEAYDENYGEERTSLPLFRGAMGRSFTITIKPQFLGLNKQEDPFDMLVHSAMTIGELRKDLSARLGILKSVNKLELFYNGTEFIDQSEDRKTFDFAAIADRCTIVVKMAENPVASSPDSSVESSPTDRSPHNEEMNAKEWETLLPSTSLSQRRETVTFLMQIADLGVRLGQASLTNTARKVLRIIPGSSAIQKQLLLACVQPENAEQSLESMFFAPSASQVLYTLEVAHAMMLPSPPTQWTNKFQPGFFMAGAVRLCLAMLGQNNFLHQADWDTRHAANIFLLRLLKFNLLIKGKLMTNRLRTKPTVKTDAHDQSFQLSQAQAHVLDIILSQVPTPVDSLCRQVINDVTRKIMWNDAFLLQERPEGSHLEILMRIAWAAGSGSPMVNQNSGPEEIHRAYGQNKDWRMNAQMEGNCREALECLTLCLAMCPSLLESHVMAQEHWKHFFVDILLSNSHAVRFAGMDQFHVIFKNLQVLVRPFLNYMVALMFNVLATTVDQRPLICREYFSVLQRLLELCHVNKMELSIDVNILLETEMKWLRHAKDFTAQNLESFPRDALLEGHLRVTKELMNFLRPEMRLKLGSGITDNTETSFVKELLEDFLLPSSKMYWEERQAVANMQRSSTVSANISGSAGTQDSSEPSGSIPRSVTTTYAPRRCVPVCGNSKSTMAAYEAIVALSNGCVGNMVLVVKTLSDMFYDDQATLLTEWEYQPQVGLRGSCTFVGLKNGGATCYMNSVFQQLFMIDSLRDGILKASPCGVDVDDEEEDETLSSIFPLSVSDSNAGNQSGDQTEEGRKEYDNGILRCIQLMFAHLLGSQLQFYVPKKFWKLFRFGNEPINLREQHDAIEFFNLLLDSCDNALKELGHEEVCKQTFGGVFVNQIISKDCEHRRDLEEEFTSISVDVRNHSSLIGSLQEYVKEDLLECDNAYKCEGCDNKKVSAIKRLCIKTLPPILAIQLKRFEFDWEREQAIKFNDYFEFPRVLDMEPYTVQGIAKRQGENPVNVPGEVEESQMKYRLRGVIIHSGQANGGHYWSYIFVRGKGDPESGKWYKFDDGDVQEYELETEEDFRDNCFGGEYQKENLMEPYMKRMQPRRQKRWWNAYVLLYEQVASMERDLAKQLEEMTLSSRLRQMPSTLEAIVRRKNTKFVHDRSQFTFEFFRFIKILCLVNAGYVQQKIGIPESTIQAKKIALLSVQLCSKFLFTTGLHARKQLRGAAQDWLDVYKVYFLYVPEARIWFATHVFCERSNRLNEYLIESTTTEVRALFQRILVLLAQYSKEDSDEPLARKLSIQPTGSLSDFVIEKVWNLICSSFADIGRNATQLFGFFLTYSTTLTIVEKEQLFRLGFPALLFDLCVEEKIGGKPIRNAQPETGPCFKALLHLLRCCTMDTSALLLPGAHSMRNPYQVPWESPQSLETPIPQRQMPEELRQRLILPSGEVKVISKLLEGNMTNTDEAKSFIMYMCWENFPLSKKVIQQCLWQMSHCYSDTKPFVDLIEGILLLQDCWHEARLHDALKGDEVQKGGLFAVMQEEHSRYARRSYLLIKIITRIFEKSAVARTILDQSVELKRRWIQAIKWLHQEMERKPFTHYNFSQWNSSVQSNEMGGSSSPLERTGSAKNILDRAVELIHTFCSEAEINEGEPVSEEEDEFAATCQNSTTSQNIPTQPPPPYTDTTQASSSSSGVRHSQSATSGLHLVANQVDNSPTEEPGKDIPQSQSEGENLKTESDMEEGRLPGIQTMQTEEDLSKLGDSETKKEDS